MNEKKKHNMELKIGEYFIPEGCTTKMVGNKLIVYKKKKNRLDIGDYRCKDCKHYVDGHSNLHYWITKVCDLKPKTLSKANEKRKENHKDFKYFKIYFCVQKYGKPCDKFELK